MRSLQSRESKVHSLKTARSFDTNARIKGFDARHYRDLNRIGISVTDSFINESGMIMSRAMDAIQPDITTPSIAVPVQLLQNWLPGLVATLTGVRNIDLFIGMMTAGDWEDEEIVQGILERVGTSVPYGDYTNIPVSSWNVNWNTQTIVRFEEGMMVGTLEEARSAKARIDSAATKRQASALALEIQRNNIGFLGYNPGGGNKTYGFLNAPGLPAYVTVQTGAAGDTTWASKTFLEIVRDIRSALVILRTQSQDIIDPERVNITLAASTNTVDYLTTVTDFGISVRDWMRKAYPNIRVVSAPQLNSANGGANVFYLYAENVEDEYSTDGGQTFLQIVPTKFRTLGVKQEPKGYLEDYTNATAGVMLKRPYAVVRMSGV